MTHVFAPTNPRAFRVQLRSDGRLRDASKKSSSKPRTASNPRSRRSPIVVAFKNPFANDAEKAKKSAESVGDGVKKAAEDTAKGAKGWWDKEVVGAKKAMDRKAGQTQKDVYADLRCTLEDQSGRKVKVSPAVICPTCDGKVGSRRRSSTATSATITAGSSRRWSRRGSRPAPSGARCGSRGRAIRARLRMATCTSRWRRRR